MKAWLFPISWVVLFFCSGSALWAQSQPEAPTLVLESGQGDHVHEIKTGTRVHYQIKGGTMQRKGRLESVSDSAMVVAGQEVQFEDVEVVVERKGHRKPAGVGLTVRSLIALPIFLLLWLLGVRLWRGGSGTGGRVLLVLFTGVAFVLLPILVILGLIIIASSTHRYDLRKGWRIHAGKGGNQ